MARWGDKPPITADQLQNADRLPVMDVSEPVGDRDKTLTVQEMRKLLKGASYVGPLAPSVHNDAGEGFGIGATWVKDNESPPAYYVLTDATVGAAVWEWVNPSAIDRLEEFPTFGDFPGTGEPGVVYVALDTEVAYRWSGSLYVAVMPALTLGESAGTAYRGDRGKAAYDHSQITSGNPHGTTLNDLGAGTAATHDVTTSATDTTSGRLLKVGDYGFGSRILPVTPPGATSNDWKSLFKKGAPTTFNYGAGNDARVNYGRALFSSSQSSNTVFESALFMGVAQPRVFYAQMRGDITDPGLEPTLVELYSTGNTTVDGNGFIKEASPIVKLFNDHIEHEGFNQETPTFQKVDTGVYKITGTSGLSQNGWYIETPTDRNNDAYFNTEWEQTPYEIPVGENGQTTEPQNVTLLIKTFERVWDAGAGRFTNGAPVDIDVAAGPDRFIALRFTEVKPVEEEPEREEGEE